CVQPPDREILYFDCVRTGNGPTHTTTGQVASRLILATFLVLQSKVPAFVGNSRTHLPFLTTVTTMQCGVAWFPMSTGPTKPCASKSWGFFSASKSDCRVSVPPPATAFLAASWNMRAAISAETP